MLSHERQTDRQTETKTDRRRERERDRQTDRQTEIWDDRQIGNDRQTRTHGTHTLRQTDRQRQRLREVLKKEKLSE